MHHDMFGRTLAIGVIALAVLDTVSDLSMPVADRRPPIAVTLTVAALLVAHGAAYWLGDKVRARITLAGYVAVQAAIVFLIGLAGTLAPLMLALYVALTVETVVLAGPIWGRMAITIGAVVLFGANAAVVWGVYRAATVAMLLAVVGLLAHAIARLFHRDAATPSPVLARDDNGDRGVRHPEPAVEVDFDRHELARLTAREREVLRALARGARTSEIAEQLDIAERTVKAHLANIYQKLGVESRTAAVAVALGSGDRADTAPPATRPRA
jgi:DNA-binding CsgD family transcriptional regulator